MVRKGMTVEKQCDTCGRLTNLSVRAPNPKGQKQFVRVPRCNVCKAATASCSIVHRFQRERYESMIAFIIERDDGVRRMESEIDELNTSVRMYSRHWLNEGLREGQIRSDLSKLTSKRLMRFARSLGYLIPRVNKKGETVSSWRWPARATLSFDARIVQTLWILRNQLTAKQKSLDEAKVRLREQHTEIKVIDSQQVDGDGDYKFWQEFEGERFVPAHPEGLLG